MGHMLDTITYSAAISACERGQQWITATTLLREMQQWHMKLDTITYSAAISACEKGQQWITATTLLREMQQVAPEAGYYHMQCRHQRMREGPAVDHSDDLAPGDVARTNEAE